MVLGLTLGVLISGPNLVTLLLLSRVLTILGHAIAILGVLGLLAVNHYMKRRRDQEKESDALPSYSSRS